MTAGGETFALPSRALILREAKGWLAAAGLSVVALILAIWPVAALPVSALAVAVAAVTRVGLLVVAVAAVALVALAGLAFALAAWPVTTAVAALALAVVLLALRSPAAALAAAAALFGFEGSVKILLGLEPTPLPLSNRAAGAGALDIALFAAVAALLVADRLRTPRAFWAGASRAERVVIVLLGLWLALSAVQVLQNGDLRQGLDGLRVFQAYALVVPAALVAVAAAKVPLARVGLAVLGVGAVIAGYAAFRVIIGPAEAEEAYAMSLPTTTQYGGAFRAVGSFTSAVGMVSFLTPVVVFAFVHGFLVASTRRLAFVVAALGLVAILASYGRAPLAGLVIGLLFAAVVLLAVGRLPARARRLAGVALVAVLAVTAVGAVVASSGTAALEERARVVSDPAGDRSLRKRLDTWERALERARDEPLGTGVGTVGRATEREPEEQRFFIADNSFLKVLVEQGVPGLLLFLGGLLGAVALLARRLADASPEARALGVAALAGLVAFLTLSLAGEYVEQPGKVVAWGLLGIAAGAVARARTT
jgi:hypothetical protein